jgi:hypothetical protein
VVRLSRAVDRENRRTVVFAFVANLVIAAA